MTYLSKYKKKNAVRSDIQFSPFLLFIGGDLLTIAKAAAKRSLLNAAVAFFEIILNQMKIELRKQNEKIIKSNSSETLEFKKRHYEELYNITKYVKHKHDEYLLNKDPLIHKSRCCNAKPYNKTMKNFTNIQDMSPILNRDTLYFYNADLRKNRRLLGRQKWNQSTKLSETDGEHEIFDGASILQRDILCMGAQLRVMKNNLES